MPQPSPELPLILNFWLLFVTFVAFFFASSSLLYARYYQNYTSGKVKKAFKYLAIIFVILFLTFFLTNIVFQILYSHQTLIKLR